MSRRKVEMVSRWRISCSRRLRTGKCFFLLLLSWFLLFHLLMLHVSRSLLLLLVAGGMANGNYRGRSKHDATSLPDHGCGCGGRGGGVVGWLLMLVGDPMYLAGLTLLVGWGRGEHCELGLVDYHRRTLVLGRCRWLREGGNILGAWGEVRPNGEGQRLRVQALRLLLLLQSLLLLLWRQGLWSSCRRGGVGREVEVGREVVDVDVLRWRGHWHPSWQICRQ